MSQNEPAAIENAEAIIERFGGIRPMANKINVPVTTVQGWKKRNIIPGARRAEIVMVAQQLGLDLSDVMQSVRSLPASNIANENGKEAPFVRLTEKAIPDFVSPRSGDDYSGDLKQQMARVEQNAVAKSIAVNVVLILLAVASVVLLLLPQNERRFSTLEREVGGIKAQQSFLSRLIPDDFEAEFAQIRSKLQTVETAFGTSVTKMRGVSVDVLSPDAGSLEQRVARLEEHVSTATGIPAGATLSEMIARLQMLSASVGGQEQIGSMASELSAFLSGVPEGDPAALEQALQSAPAQNPALAEAFAGVPPQDMKAAALLLGMTQFRSTLERDNQSFENDLVLLKKLVGNEDPQLLAAIDRLAPQAQQGVLTPAGLSKEFRGLAGDVVVASLQGEDVSLEDKAKARLGDILQVEKNGEPISGTPTQNTLAKADKMLEAGDIEGALRQIRTLDGPAAVAIQPWVSKAEATVLAHQFKNVLNQFFGKKIGDGVAIYGSPSRGLNISGATEMMKDQETGITILRSNSSPALEDPLKQ